MRTSARPSTSGDVVTRRFPFACSRAITSVVTPAETDSIAPASRPAYEDHRFALADGLTCLAEIGAHGTVVGPDPSLVIQPANAIQDALRRDGTLTVADPRPDRDQRSLRQRCLASVAPFGVSLDRVNVNGGAIAFGHPVGMSGARLVLTLANELRRRGGGNGVVALCGGGRQGDALLLKVS